MIPVAQTAIKREIASGTQMRRGGVQQVLTPQNQYRSVCNANMLGLQSSRQRSLDHGGPASMRRQTCSSVDQLSTNSNYGEQQQNRYIDKAYEQLKGIVTSVNSSLFNCAIEGGSSPGDPQYAQFKMPIVPFKSLKEGMRFSLHLTSWMSQRLNNELEQSSQSTIYKQVLEELVQRNEGVMHQSI